MSANPFPDIFDSFFQPKPRTPEQQACSHILSSQMHDEKYFCPICHLVSNQPLNRRAS